jgi:quinol monooxygenase YgiN
MVVLLARASIKPEERDRLLALVRTVAGPSRAEEGCDAYLIYESVERPNDFIFVERWRSLDDLRAHFQTSHFGEFFAALPTVVVAPPDVQIYDVHVTVAFEEVLAGAGMGQ